MLSVASIVGLSLALSAAPQAAPPASDQQRMLENTRRYASQYVTNLPNFICLQVTSQFEAGRKPTHWRKGDTLASKLLFSQGHEERSLELVNNKPVRPGRFLRTPLTTEGEFGILIANVLDGETDAVINWDHWEDLRGKRLAVFKYSVDKQHSTVSLSLGDLINTIVPYRGLIYSDPDSGVVWRITDSPFDIPDSVLTKSVETTIDYGPVSVAGQTYFMPIQASVWLDTGSENVLNRTEYRDYRKFEAESKIIFDSTSTNPAPAQFQ